jgi:hypothetical protein
MARGHAAPSSAPEEIPSHRLESACSVDGQPISKWDRVSREGVHMRDRVFLRSLMLAIVMVLFVAACSSDEPVAGPVTIENEVDFSSPPVSGTFEVTEGGDVLGCSSGTFVDSGTPDSGIERVYACDSGSNEGSFAASFIFDANPDTTGDNGTWTVVEGSDEFVGLQGSGDWSIVYPTPDERSSLHGIGVGTWTGDINYTS